ncbi:MAG TPA: ABC transporter permease [Vicinamibacterales bacterium]|nr:ABC transporter permease [Vicinamibacterales bacterium]
MTPRRSRLGRLLAAMLIRGAEAPFILRDLEDSFHHDASRGLAPAAVRRRDLQNIVVSIVSVWAASLRLSAWRPSLIDVRLGLRSIMRTPGLSIVAVCALAIGIPVGLAPMHAVDALERPLPGDPDGRIRTLCYWRDTVHEHATAGDFSLWRTTLESFDTLAAFRPTTVNLEVGGAGLSLNGIETTASTFEILRAPAMLGRGLRADDERPGAPDVIVVGHDLWRAQFGSDPSVVGRTVAIGGTPFSIVGVMPPSFRFPTSHQLWMPLRVRADGAGPRSGAALVVFGKLSDGVTPDAAEAELQTLTRSLAAGNAEPFDRLRATVLPTWHLTFGFPSPGGLRALPEFYLVQVLMLAPLFIACVNVGLLILAQTSTRASEFALRTALGAGRGRILTQVFVEFMVLAVMAAGVGLLILGWLSGRLMTALGIALPYWIDTGLTAATVLRGLVLAAGCAAIAGVVPAIRMTGRSIDTNIKRAGASRAGGRVGPGRLSSALIVIDVAVAVVAIGVAGGLWGKVQATMPNESVDGIRAGEILSVTLQIPATERVQVARAQSALVERLRREPEVRAVTFATALPRMDHPVRLMDVEDDATASAAAGPFKVRTARIAIDFFDQLNQPVVAGRAFDSRDLNQDAGTVIVNTTFARRAFGSNNAIGRRVRLVASDRAPVGGWLEIVGVVGRMGVHPLTPSEDDGVYFPVAEGDVNPLRLAIWTRGDPAALAPRVHELAGAVDPNAVITMPVPLDQMFEGDWYFLKAFVLAAAILVGVLLSLAASALYAILSLAVSQRTREIGIRVALGADRWRIARDVASRAVVQIGIGVLIGLPFAGALCYEFLELTRSGASIPGAAAMAAVLGGTVMLLVALTACTVPTLRALRIAPVDALRKD